MFRLEPRLFLRRFTSAAVLLLALFVGFLSPLSASAAPTTPEPTPQPKSAPTSPHAPQPMPDRKADQKTSAGSRLKVISPRANSLQHGDVRIKVRVPAGTRHIRMRVAGQDVSRTVRRHGRFVTARLRSTRAKRGQASVVMWARTAGGDPLFAQVPIVIAQHRQRLLAHTPRITTRNGTAAVHLTCRVRPTKLEIQLNGRTVRLLRQPRAGTTSVPLAADDGLRFGSNTVKIVGYEKKSGRWVSSTERFHMSRSAPLVSAGQDTRVRLGAPVGLDAAATKWTTASNAATRSYQWRIVRQPAFGNARLLNPTAAKSSLAATRPGVYRISVDVREKGRLVSTDTVTTEQTPNMLPYGAEISTLVDNGDGTFRTTIQGVPLDAAGDDYIDTPNEKIQIIVLDKRTLEVIPDQTQQVSGNADTLGAIHGVTSDQLGILVGAKGCCDPSETVLGLNPANGFTSVFSNGGTTEPILQNAGIALGGAPNGAISAWVRTAADPNWSGYTITNATTAPFDTAPHPDDPSTISVTLGGQNYYFDKPSPQGIVLVSVAADMATSVFGQVYGLTGGNSDDATLTSIANELNSIAEDDPGAVVAFQTWGAPPITSPPAGDVANALDKFGGTPNLFIGLAGGGNYALVGRANANASPALQAIASTEQSSAPNVGTTLTPEVSLRGLLGRGTDSLPVVLGSTASPVGTDVDQFGNTYTPNPLGLVALAQAAPQPWPAMDGTKAAAYAAISQTIGTADGLGDPNNTNVADCYTNTSSWDIRAEYCNGLEESKWNGVLTTRLNAIDCSQGGTGYTASDCVAVRAQLLKEFPMVPTIQDFIKGLQGDFTGTGAWASNSFNDSVGKVTDSLKKGVPPPPATTSAQQFVSDLLQPVQDLDIDPEFTFGAGIVASVLDLSLNQTTTDDGDPALDTFTADEDSIGTEALTRLQDSDNAIGALQNILLTDWTKMSTTNYNVGSIWGQNPDTQSVQTAQIKASVNTWLYAAELPLSYGQIAVNPAGGSTVDGVNAFSCQYRLGSGDTWYPFTGAQLFDPNKPPIGGTPLQASAMFAPTTSVVDRVLFSPYIYVLGNAIDNSVFQLPTAALTDPLFDPVGQGDGTAAGLNAAQFYTWAWSSGQNRTEMTQYIYPDGPLNSQLREGHEITNPMGPSQCTFA